MPASWIRLNVDAFGSPPGAVLRIDSADPRLPQLVNARLAVPVADPGGTPPVVPTTDPNALLRLGNLADDLARDPEALISGTVTRNPSGMVTSADVRWPDDTPGVYTATIGPSGAVDSYTVTYGIPAQVTYTQPPVVRNATGAVTTRPPIVVS